MMISPVAPITIQPWPLPVVPTEPGNGGIVPPWLNPSPVPQPKPPHNGNPGIVPPWLQ